MKNTLRWLLFISSLVLCVLAAPCSSRADVEYTVSSRPDGGYILHIAYSKRHFFTAEGMFPLEKRNFVVEIKGNGTTWNWANPKGTYYSSDEVTSERQAWDVGYAWMDPERKSLYLNFYWVSPPDGLLPSDVNGKYDLVQSGRKK